MPGIIVPRTGIIKPPPWPVEPGLVAPEWRWVWDRAAYMLPLWGDGLPPYNAVNNSPPLEHALQEWADSPMGPGLRSATAGARSKYHEFQRIALGTEISWALVVERQGLMGLNARIWGSFDGPPVRGFQRGTDTNAWWRLSIVEGGTHYYRSGGQILLELDTPRLLIGRWRSGGMLEFRKYELGTGRLITKTENGPYTGHIAADHSSRHDYLLDYTSSTAIPCPAYAAYGTGSWWTDEQCSQLATDPFGPFRPAQKLWWPGWSGDGPVEVTTTTARVLLRAASIVVSAGAIAATLATASANLSAHPVTAGTPATTVTVNTATMAGRAFDVVALATAASISLNTASVEVSAYPVSVVSGPQSVTLAVASLGVRAYGVEVLTGSSPVAVTVDLANIRIRGHAIGVQASPTLATLATASVNLSAHPATAEAAVTTVTVNTASVEVSAYPVEVLTGRSPVAVTVDLANIRIRGHAIGVQASPTSATLATASVLLRGHEVVPALSPVAISSDSASLRVSGSLVSVAVGPTAIIVDGAQVLFSAYGVRINILEEASRVTFGQIFLGIRVSSSPVLGNTRVFFADLREGRS